MAGLPCVATDVGASSEIAGDGAVLVPPRDPVALAEAIRQMTRLDPAARARMGESARTHAAGCCSLESVVASYATLLETIARPASERPTLAVSTP
jgi:glycosyltransferase involved in cell wall biosynthesis